VPMEARRKLLQLTAKYHGFAVASFTSGEMAEAKESGMLGMSNLVAMNIDEAAALLQTDVTEHKAEDIVEKTVSLMQNINPSAMLSITAGKRGSWSWDGVLLKHIGVVPVEVKRSPGL
jgi:ribokinase